MTLIHERTEALLHAYIKNPGKPLLLIGGYDDGLQEVLHLLTESLLPPNQKQYIVVVKSETENKVLTVEQIREAQKHLRTKQTKEQDVSRFIIFDCTNGISDEAQQAFLKTLEEPPHGMLICLVVPQIHMLRDTVISRCQRIPLLPITRSQAIKYAEMHTYDQKEAEQNYYMSGGASTLFVSLLEVKDSPLRNNIKQAKEFLQFSIFDRLLLQKNYDSQEKLTSLIEGLLKITSGAMKFSNRATQEWKRRQELLVHIQDDIKTQVTTKLLFTKLCLEL